MSQFRTFLEQHVQEVRPLTRAINLAYWQATISGTETAFDRLTDAQVQLQRVYANKAAFDKLSDWLAAGQIHDDMEARQIAVLHKAYLRNQIEPGLNEQMTKLSSRIENAFNVHRAMLDGKEVTRNDIAKILKESRDSNLRERAWAADKAVAAVVESDLLNLITLRNEAAVSLDFRNYYVMTLELSDQNETDIVRFFDELEALTRAPFRQIKTEIDEHLAARYGITVQNIRPWHYEDSFFQEAPRVYDVDIDKFYEGHEVVELAARSFSEIGLPADDILARSDLYEKPGKGQHAYCTDIDREGDIRILANVKNDETWAGTMLHELGHAVHDKYIDETLPYLLRQEAHIFTTEAIAMLFGRLSKDPQWIQHMIGLSDEEQATVGERLVKHQRLAQIVFARWSQVMMRFEHELYDAPSQDLNALWWKNVEQYQFVKRPEQSDFPHWAAKSHLVSAPVYYHNYLLGEILASQLTHHIKTKVLSGGDLVGYVVGSPKAGEYLKTQVFAPGARYRWDDMIERATGEPLSPKYFVEQYVR